MYWFIVLASRGLVFFDGVCFDRVCCLKVKYLVGSYYVAILTHILLEEIRERCLRQA